MPSPGTSPFGTGRSSTPCTGCARRAIEDEHVCRLANQSERWCTAPVARYVHERGGRRLIRIPQIVMHALEVPQVLPLFTSTATTELP